MSPIELLLTKLLNCSYMDLYLDGVSLSPTQKKVLDEMLAAYLDGKPVQYILGEAEFMGLTFKVQEGVFIPRPETEILVEAAEDILRNQLPTAASLKILDIGTGSGCIAVSLAKLLAQAEITAVDISDEALRIAEENAKIHGVSEKIKFCKSDLFACQGLPVDRYDIIVSNPPYIPLDEMGYLPLEVQHEPRVSLEAGKDGLIFFRQIIRQAAGLLKKSGYLFLEIGDNQAQDICGICEKSESFRIIDIIKDYNSIERVVVARKL